MASDFVHTSAPAASIGDFTFIKELVARAHASGELWALSWTAKAVNSEITQAQSWIASDNFGRRLGFAFVRPPGIAWEITLVALENEMRGADVFRTLLGSIRQRALEEVAGGGASSGDVDLEVRADNRSAIRAYEKNGFLKTGIRNGYYSDGVDAVLYRLKS
jgi:ribosomal-protein-alanine N-acetyltransferase